MYRLSVRCDNHKQCSAKMRFKSQDIECIISKKKSHKKDLERTKDLQGNASYEDCEFADDAISLNGDVSVCYSDKDNKVSVDKKYNQNATVNGKEELPCIHKYYLKNSTAKTANQAIMKSSGHCLLRNATEHGNLNGNCHKTNLKHVYGYCTLPKSKRKISNSIYLSKILLPPKRITPDGTHIYYWCDVHRKENVAGKLFHK